MQQIQALRFEIDQVGKHVKGSKKRFTWDIALKDKHHTIVLDFSFISGKVKITVDRKILLENELPSNVSFQYPFTLDGFALNIIQQGQTFELRLNNKVFSHLYTQQRTNTQFKKYEDEVKDIKVNVASLNPPNKKISLNIGAFGGMKKKKEAVGQAGSWDAFSGGSFPNYFGDNAQPTEEKKQEAPQKKVSLLDEEQQTKAESVSKPQKDLLGDDEESIPSQPIFDMTPSSPQTSNNAEEFNTMQNMFATMNVASQPEKKQVDFFADQSPQEATSPSSPPKATTNNTSSGFDMNFSSTNQQNFATGFGFQPSNISAKSFATSSPGNRPLQVDFFNMPSKQEQSSPNAFSKKQSPSQQQVSESENKSQKNANESKLTDMSLNDFISDNKQGSQAEFQMPESFGQPNANDFNTMQNMFQTSAGGQSAFGFPVQQASTSQPTAKSSVGQPNENDFNTMQNMFQTSAGGQSGFGSANQHGSILAQPTANIPTTAGFDFSMGSTSQPNENDFSTMQNMFATNNYAGQQSTQKPVTNISQSKQPEANFSKNPTPQAFATMSGGASGGFDFDMSSFGTMQAGSAKGGQKQFDLMMKKGTTEGQTSADLI